MIAQRRFVIPRLPTGLLYLSAGTQKAFHGINKSGSLAMANVLKEAFDYSELSSNIVSHYHLGGTVDDYIAGVNSRFFCNKLLISHYLYGALAPRPSRVWITQFRHPLPRILSCYQWLKNKYERLNGVGSYDSLEVFVVKSKGVAHSQVAQFSFNWGARRSRLSRDLNANEMLALSMDAVERDFSLIGIAEYFEESIFIFASLCGLTSVAPWVRDVRNPGRLYSSEISKANLDLITETFKADFALYEWALSRFQSQLKVFNFGSELDAYKASCSSQYNDRIIS